MLCCAWSSQSMCGCSAVLLTTNVIPVHPHRAVVVVVLKRHPRLEQDSFSSVQTGWFGRKIGLLYYAYGYWTSCNKPSHCIAPRDITYLLHYYSLLSQFSSCLHKSITCRCHMYFPGARATCDTTYLCIRCLQLVDVVCSVEKQSDSPCLLICRKGLQLLKSFPDPSFSLHQGSPDEN